MEEMLTIEPPPAARMGAMAARMPRNVPSRLTDRMRLKPSMVSSSMARSQWMAALFTRTVTGPKASVAVAMTCSQPASLETSWRTKRAPSPSSLATVRPSSSRTSVSTTDAPSATKCRASASPWPRAAPVMTGHLAGEAAAGGALGRGVEPSRHLMAGFLRCKPDRQVLDPGDEVGPQPARLAERLHLRHPAGHLLPEDAQLHAGQAGAEAVMGAAATEGHVLVRRPLDVEGNGSAKTSSSRLADTYQMVTLSPALDRDGPGSRCHG